MQLPSRLRQTTLGDLLGMLHRTHSTGTLELSEERGRLHRVHLAKGLVTAVEVDGTSAALAEILRRDRAAADEVLRRSLLRALASRRLHGEVLVEEYALSPTVVGDALRRQVLERLTFLEEIDDARIAFRVALRPPRWALFDAPLGPSEFLRGRRRARDRRPAFTPPADERPWRVLGLSPGSDVTQIKRAYRQLVRAVHPDLHPGITDEERRALELRFVEINSAFRSLVA